MKKLLLTAALILFPATAQAACGQASWYGPGLYGNLTASGEVFRPGTKTAAHPWYPLGTYVRVTNRDNGRSVTVRINDRGPYAGGRILDLSYGAFAALASPSRGVINVCIA
jgi:rare lipoprotein A